MKPLAQYFLPAKPLPLVPLFCALNLYAPLSHFLATQVLSHGLWLRNRCKPLGLAFIIGIFYLSLAMPDAMAFQPQATQLKNGNNEQALFPNIYWKHIQSYSGITLGSVNNIHHDSHGYIWLSTQDGLVRFDGYDFKLYQHQKENDRSLLGGNTWPMLEDKQGNIWIGAQDGLSRYNRLTDDFTSFKHNEDDPNSVGPSGILALEMADDGTLYVGSWGGGVSILKPNGSTFTHLRHNPNDTLSIPNDYVWSLLRDKNGYLWVGTEGGGVAKISPFGEPAVNYNVDAPKPYRINSNQVRGISQDHQGFIWLATDGGAHKLDKREHVSLTLQRTDDGSPSLASSVVWDVLADSQGYIWLATDGGGVSLYEPTSGAIRTFMRNPEDPLSISTNVVRGMVEDNNGNIWTANFPSGANVFHRKLQHIELLRNLVTVPNSLNQPSVLAAVEDNQNNLWIGTDGGGVNKLNLKSGEFSYFNRKNTAGFISDAILDLALDSQGNLWAGTWGGGLTHFNTITHKARHFPVNKTTVPNAPTPFSPQSTTANTGTSHKSIWAVKDDGNGSLWLGTEGGGANRYDYQTQLFEHLPYNEDSSSPQVLSGEVMTGRNVWVIHPAQDGTIWLGTDQGLSQYNPSTKQFNNFIHNPDDARSIISHTIFDIYVDAQGMFWLATPAGVNIFDPVGLSFSKIENQDLFTSQNIYSVNQDTAGDLWFGTNDGLTRYNPISHQVKNFAKTTWAKGKYGRHARTTLDTGELVFGNINGALIFNPLTLQDDSGSLKVVLTQLQIFNKIINVNDESHLLPHAIDQLDHLTLSHRESMFSLTYAALNFDNTENIKYAYQLKGFDSTWNQVGSERKATYTNLNAGDYIFNVKARHGDGRWNSTVKMLRITILPAPWYTWWAYSLYALALLLLVSSFVYRQKKKLEHQKLLVSRMQALDTLKDDFLANTSHELKTPLNGIIGIADSLLAGVAGELTKPAIDNLKIITQSGRRLANLVNDILDYSKMRNRELVLHRTKLDIKKNIYPIVTLCNPMIGEKELVISIEIPSDIPLIYVDENRFQQILFNLIGNAIKFTKRGKIIIYANLDDEDTSWVWLHIKDTGIGIPDDKLDAIFSSFEQIEDHQTRKNGGTGLGLSITKTLVELHGGHIKVSSSLGQGSVFSLSFPVSQTLGTADSHNLGELSSNLIASLSELEHEQDATQHDASDEHNFQPNQLANTSTFTNLSKLKHAKKILVVDDDRVNRQVLINQITVMGHGIEWVSSGSDALLKIWEDTYDLVLLDIMMPDMSGYEVCHQIREKFNKQTLPIIFITAKNLAADLAQAFASGGNDYLPKPIVFEELKSRIETQLELLDKNRDLEAKITARTLEVEQGKEVLETLDGIVSAINRDADLKVVVNLLLTGGARLFPQVDQFTLWWQQDDCISLMQSFPGCHSATQNLMISGQSLREKIHIFGSELEGNIFTLQNDAFLADKCHSLTRLFNDSSFAFIIPIEFEESFMGILVLTYHQIKSENALKLVPIVRRFAEHARSALTKVLLLELLKGQNKDLEEISQRDPLTGLHNRRYFGNRIELDIKTVLEKRHSHSLTLDEKSHQNLIFFTLDIDHFKTVNDTYGHAAGDRILIEVTSIIKQAFRDNDFVIRWGGEEFLMVARFASRLKATEIAERVRKTIAEHTFDLGNGTVINKTCSLGFVPFPLYDKYPSTITWADIVVLADQCLYAAKRSGRNTWVGITGSHSPSNENTLNNKDMKSLIKTKQIIIESNTDHLIW